MGMTMTQKILAAHAGLDSVVAGQLIEANLDMVLGNDGRVYVRRVRSIPGLDRQSIFTRLITDSGFAYEDMIRLLIGSVVEPD